jgi:hypothetical protein
MGHDFSNFQKNYVHLNTTPQDYELFCYERWFILRKFMLDKSLDTVFYADSDVLLFCDVQKEWSKYDQYSLTLLHRTAAISSFITFEAINNFCSMLENVYSNKNSYLYKKIASHFSIRQESGLAGGVCDMTLFELFHYSHEFGGGPGRVGEMMAIIDDSTYDHNINAKDQDFSFKNGTKQVTFKNGQPYVFNERSKKDILFNSIHFQGSAKSLMKSAFDLSQS